MFYKSISLSFSPFWIVSQELVQTFFEPINRLLLMYEDNLCLEKSPITKWHNDLESSYWKDIAFPPLLYVNYLQNRAKRYEHKAWRLFWHLPLVIELVISWIIVICFTQLILNYDFCYLKSNVGHSKLLRLFTVFSKWIGIEYLGLIFFRIVV